MALRLKLGPIYVERGPGKNRNVFVLLSSSQSVSRRGPCSYSWFEEIQADYTLEHDNERNKGVAHGITLRQLLHDAFVCVRGLCQEGMLQQQAGKNCGYAIEVQT